MIELRHVSKTYYLGNNRVEAVKDIHLSIKKGDFTALIGPSGCGKSTAMAIIGLLDHPTEGSYWLHDQDTATFSPNKLAGLRNRTIGFVFQAFYLLPSLSALENVGLPLVYSGLKLTPPEINQRALESMEQVGIAQFARHTPNEMSGGQQQRVAIARALVGKPSIVLADEPTGSLDSKTGQNVMDILVNLNRTEQTTILLVTHDQQIAKQCQRILPMKDGRFLDA